MMKRVFSVSILSMLLLGGINPVLVQADVPPKNTALTSPPTFLNGVWEGNYTCAQGLTSLKLIIEAKSNTDIDAVFIFSEHPQNPGVPSGRFRMSGHLEQINVNNTPSILLDLVGTTWIQQPSGYQTVDLRGLLSETRQSISGRVMHPTCKNFTVIKRLQ